MSSPISIDRLVGRVGPSLAFLLVLVGLMLVSGGCKKAVLGIPVAIEGYEDSTAGGGVATAIDISNGNGSVWVIADPRFKKPEVFMKAKSPNTKRLKVKPDWLTVDSSVQDGQPMLRIRSEPPVGGEQGGDEQFTNNLVVRVPACRNITVRNAGGLVEVRNVSGVIDIQNGFDTLAGGDVILRTNEAITEPLLVYSSNGNVHCQIGMGSKGVLEIASDDGVVQVDAGDVPFTGIKNPSDSRWTGVMNGGTNALVVRTGKGIARLMVREDAAGYRPMPAGNAMRGLGF
jgi:hypothetical protein